MWRAIWNGPFYIGRLERPVTVGEAVMKVLETAWRAAVLIVAAYAAVIAWLIFSSWRGEKIREAARETVTYHASADLTRCPRTAPIFISVHNPSKEHLWGLSFRVQLLKNGRDIAPRHFQNQRVPVDLDAGAYWTACLNPWEDDYGAYSGFGDLSSDIRVNALQGGL